MTRQNTHRSQLQNKYILTVNMVLSLNTLTVHHDEMHTNSASLYTCTVTGSGHWHQQDLPTPLVLF